MLRSSRRYAGGGIGVKQMSGKTKLQPVVKFRDWKCEVWRSEYIHNNRPALVLLEVGTGEPILTATSNLVDEECGSNQTFIKDFAENSGILEVLIAAGIAKDTGVRKISGYCSYPLVDVLM